MNELEGDYYLEYFGRDRTRVTYQCRSNPGGNVPVGLANTIELQHYPSITLNGLRRMASKKNISMRARLRPSSIWLNAC